LYVHRNAEAESNRSSSSVRIILSLSLLSLSLLLQRHMQFKGLLMTQPGRQAPLAKLPGCTFGFYHLSALKSRFSSRRWFLHFYCAANGQARFSTLPGPAFK
jgi:hypothetical protein